MSKPRLKWYKSRRARIDAVLATNGAAGAPDRYELRVEDGEQVYAIVQRLDSSWRYRVIPIAYNVGTLQFNSGPFADLAMCKAAAKKRVDEHFQKVRVDG